MSSKAKPEPRRHLALAPREIALKKALDDVRSRCDSAARRSADPVGFVHRYADRHDRELVALVSACVAFGNVRTIRAKLGDLLVRVGPSPAAASDDGRTLLARLRGWKHRVFVGRDIGRLLVGARHVQRAHGSLGAFFGAALERADRGAALERADRGAALERADRRMGRAPAGATRLDAPCESDAMRRALSELCEAIRAAGGLRPEGRRRGPQHLLPNPAGTSASKRLLLFLRWMIRPADGVDLGDWSIDEARLLVPVDTHIHKLARNIGLTARRDVSWRTTEEITRALARLDPKDPVKYDFSLCHLGMLQHCPSLADAVRCEGCGVRPVCVHWAGPPGT